MKMNSRQNSILLVAALALICGVVTTNQSKLRAVDVQAAAQDKPFNQAQALADLNKKIAGQETKPASEVFKNIQILKDVPAARILRIMENGYAKSLGVTCDHCHVTDAWEKDDRPAKQIARDMMQMVSTINSQLLKNIKNLKGPNSIVNCTTCHRGQLKPALNLPG